MSLEEKLKLLHAQCDALSIFAESIDRSNLLIGENASWELNYGIILGAAIGCADLNGITEEHLPGLALVVDRVSANVRPKLEQLSASAKARAAAADERARAYFEEHSQD